MSKKKYVGLSVLILILLGTCLWLNGFKNQRYQKVITDISDKYSKAAMVSIEYFEQFDEEEVRSNYSDPLDMVYFYAMKSRYSLLKGNIDGIFNSIDEAVIYAKKSPYYNNVIIEVYNQGLEMSNMQHNTYRAIEYCHKLINLLNDSDVVWVNEIQKQKVEISVYSKQLLLLSDYKILDKAKYYYDLLESIEIHEDLPPVVERSAIFAKTIYLSTIKDYKGAKEQSILAYESLKKQDEETGSNIKDAGLMNIAYADIELGNYDDVENKLFKSIDFYTSMNDIQSLNFTKSNLGIYYIKVKDFDKAYKYISEAISIWDELGNDYEKLEMLELLIANKEAFEKYINMNDVFQEHYYLSTKVEEIKETSNVIEAIIDINDELNLNYTKSVKEKNIEIIRKNKAIISIAIILTIITIVLFWLLGRLKKEVIKRKKNENQLKKIIDRDYLTGCSTKEAGLNKISELISRNIEFSLSVIDIDNFKNINDTYGHIYGDNVLRTVAKVLMDNLDGEDFVLRFGGEEFILVSTKSNDETIELFENKRKEVEEIEFDKNICVTISQGVARRIDEENIKNLIEKADTLLYKAKRTGKNKVQL